MEEGPKFDSQELALTRWQRFKDGFAEVFKQIASSDLNLGEGRARASIVPSEYIDIPDYPLIDDAI